jgi:uncharacterized membrane protein YhaH (DUF805 family)
MNVSQSIATCFAKFATFSGRASRPEYWWFMLSATIFSYILQIMVGITMLNNAGEGAAMSIFMNLLFIVIAIPQISAGSRRLHDTGRSGWWQLLGFTVIGLIPLVIWLAQDGAKESNKYDDPANQVA